MGQTFKEFMNEEKPVNRWLILQVGLIGAFAGACVMLMFALLGLVG